jgi:hypothetical protein
MQRLTAKRSARHRTTETALRARSEGLFDACARGVIGARYSSTVRARRPMSRTNKRHHHPATKAAHAAGGSGGRLSGVQSDICMDVYGVLDGQAHACAGASWLCSVRNVGDVSKINLARTRAHACMRGAKDRRQRDEPGPEASIGLYFQLGGSVPRRRSRPKHASLDCAAVPWMVLTGLLRGRTVGCWCQRFKSRHLLTQRRAHCPELPQGPEQAPAPWSPPTAACASGIFEL